MRITMNVIIIGCGKVGATLAVQLSKESNDVCLIDTDYAKIEQLVNVNDIIGICGNGSNYSVLQEAGISEADLLIAVTGSDELNLLCCVIAQKASNCKMIARVRNPVYQQESDFLQKELGLTMIINPELLAAQEMFQVLCFPNAIEIGFFTSGQVEMIRYRISNDSLLNEMSIKDVAAKVNENLLICAIERDGVVTIPNGDSVLATGDTISILATKKTAVDFFHAIKASKNPVKNTMIIGGGKIAVYLAKMLTKSGIKVKIIEQDEKRCEELSELLPNVTVIQGDGSDRTILKEERIDQLDSFAALTNFDEENILLSLYAMKMVDKKVVTKINRFQLNEVVYNLNLDSVIYPKNLTTERILQYVRSKKNSIRSNNIKTLYRLHEDKVEALEFYIEEESAITNVPLSKLQFKKNILIGCITRNGKSIIPNGNDEIKVGDSIIVVTTTLGLKDSLDIL